MDEEQKEAVFAWLTENQDVLNQLIVTAEHRAWLVAGIRTSALWFTSVMAAWLVFWPLVKKVLIWLAAAGG